MPGSEENRKTPSANSRKEKLSVLIGKLQSPLSYIKSASLRHNVVIFCTCAFIFLIGIVFSVVQLDFSIRDIEIAPLLLIVFLVIPLIIAYSAINILVMAKATHASISIRDALQVSVWAGLAEVLPIPGGAMVRSAALTRAGAKLGASVDLVLSFALLWIACALLGLAYVFRLYHSTIILVMIPILGLILILVIWLSYRYSFSLALQALALRLFGLLLVCLRVGMSFAMLGIAYRWEETPAFAFAIIAGTATSIIPAGLGISEGLSAAIAIPLSIAPEGAFLAIAFSRILGLALNLVIAGFFILVRKRANITGKHPDE